MSALGVGDSEISTASLELEGFGDKECSDAKELCDETGEGGFSETGLSKS